jgi:2-polyprenyl-3-methyl-5-hydroxy-6-metoxy-1,4-benzoquinol methylase
MTLEAPLSPSAIQNLAAGLYASSASAKVRLTQSYRAHICPLHEVIQEVPPHARVLDVGCGHGLLLNLLARLGRIQQGHGFDVAAPAIGVANDVAKEHGLSATIAFEHRTVEQGIPGLGHEVVTVVDVLHHVPDEHKAQFFRSLCDVVPPGGRLIVKDMVVKPRWRAAANQMHDLVMARQWVAHVGPDQVEVWAAAEGMRVVRKDLFNTWWYGHWLLVMEKPPSQCAAP